MDVQNWHNTISKVIIKSQPLQFLCLSFISGIVELASIAFSFQQNLSPIAVIGIGLSYQMGNLLPIPIKLSWSISSILASCSLILFLYVYYTKFNYWLFFLAVALFSGCLQIVRSITKGEVPTFIKRLARVAGFLCTPIIRIPGFVICCLVVLLMLYFGRNKAQKSALYFPRLGLLHIIMIVHQIHYFCYAYTILFWIMTLLNNQLLTGFVFALGWWSYISVPFLLKGYSYIKYAILGHLLLTFILTVLAFSQNSTFIVILWILTGFGGGTVFCISKLFEKSKISIKHESITFSENIGHFLGVVISLILFYWTNSIPTTILSAAFFAFLTAILLLVYSYVNRYFLSTD